MELGLFSFFHGYRLLKGRYRLIGACQAPLQVIHVLRTDGWSGLTRGLEFIQRILQIVFEQLDRPVLAGNPLLQGSLQFLVFVLGLGKLFLDTDERGNPTILRPGRSLLQFGNLSLGSLQLLPQLGV